VRNRALGDAGEDLAASFLKKKGYKIICRNYSAGRKEIDIIASHRGRLCFIEVKSRKQNRFGLGQESVSRLKQSRIITAAAAFLEERKLADSDCRFDVVCIDYSGPLPKIELIEGAFDATDKI